MKIRILPQHVIDKIAAGEVVERPASVVKELMENSLDAGATQVLIKIGESITAMIEVVDDGEGMGREEALTAIRSHSTSKIVEDKDLLAITTFGFRGEALPSIATVSNMEIETRTQGSPFGIKVMVEAGTVTEVKEVGIPRGTRGQVKDLFHHTPARLKFLRSAATEWGHVQDVFMRLGLSKKEIRFQLWRGGRQWVNAPPTQDIQQRIGQMLGWELAEILYPFEAQDGHYTLQGMMARPDYHRVTGRDIFFFVNGRPVRDLFLQKSLREAYRTHMPKERFPVVLAFLEIPLDQVDVNVHPSKLEVRFAQPLRVRSLLHATLVEMLRKSPWDRRSLRPLGVSDAAPVMKESSSDKGWARQSRFAGSRLRSAGEYYDTDGKGHVDPGRTSQGEAITCVDQGLAKEEEKDSEQPSLWPEALCRFSTLHILGQFRDAFLVCESTDHLVLIDQHAAHERVAFEKLKKAFCQARIEQQILLLPSVVELSPRDAEALARHLSDLYSWGIEVESYGGNSFVVKALPMLLVDAQASTLLRDVAEELVEMEQVLCIEDLRDHVFARMACHSVIRGRRHMETSEIEALLREMDAVDFSLNCPHGRPVMASWSLYDIEKRFHRT